MVHFPGLLQLKLFNGLRPDFGTVRGLVFELSLELFFGILWNVVWNVLWASLCHNWSGGSSCHYLSLSDKLGGN